VITNYEVIYQHHGSGWVICKPKRYNHFHYIKHACDGAYWMASTSNIGPICCNCGSLAPYSIINVYRMLFLKNPYVVGEIFGA
jgi:hypothetical protein